MKIWRTLVLLSVFGLGACEMPEMPSWARLPDLSNFSLSGEGAETGDQALCKNANRKKAAAFDWTKARHLDIYLRSGKLSPAVVVLKVGMPNVIRLFNTTKGVWSFRAEEFFRSADVVKIVYGGKVISETCIDAIKIGGRKWAELYVVPLRQGEFFFGEKESTFNPLAAKSQIGQIIVR